jgi:hypothetical protein
VSRRTSHRRPRARRAPPRAPRRRRSCAAARRGQRRGGMPVGRGDDDVAGDDEEGAVVEGWSGRRAMRSGMQRRPVVRTSPRRPATACVWKTSSVSSSFCWRNIMVTRRRRPSVWQTMCAPVLHVCRAGQCNF